MCTWKQEATRLAMERYAICLVDSMEVLPAAQEPTLAGPVNTLPAVYPRTA